MARPTTQQGPSPHAHGPFAAWKLPELKGVDDLSARCFRAFLSTAKLHFKNMMTSQPGSRIHPGQALCLRLLESGDGPTQRDMARMLHVSPPTVSKMLSAMEKTGLVERRPDEADQRLTRVYLTAAGRERSEQMSETVGDYVNATFATLTERERRDLARLLEKLGARISEVTASACEQAAADEEAGR